MTTIHITPTMLINRAPHKPLSPFKVRRRGANACWNTVKKHYGSTRHSGQEKKTDANRAQEQTTSAFIKGWKDVWLDIGVDAARWETYVSSWKNQQAQPEHLRAAYIAGREFYHEQFPEGSAKPVLHPQRLAA